MTREPRLLLAFFIPVLSGFAHGQTSTLVSQQHDGSLVYGSYANEGETETVNRMIDFSFAGYEGGGKVIPWVPAVVTLEPDVDGMDDFARIQAAINEVSALGVAGSGFRGAVVLRAGHYSVSQTLTIEADGVVIRGEGQGEDGTVITFTSTEPGADWSNGRDILFEFHGSGGWTTLSNAEKTITDSFVPSGTRQLTLNSVTGFNVGDRVLVSRHPNQAWIDLLGMGQPGIGWTPQEYRSDLPRRVEAISGNTITIDVPITHAIDSRYGGGTVSKYHFDGALRNVGVENIRLESVYQSGSDEDHGWIGVEFRQVENAWARRVTARHFAYSCVAVHDHSQFVTVEDCAMLDPKSQVTGGRRYSFVIDDASYVLFQRCYTRSGRHDYVVQSKTIGPNVFVDCVAENTLNDTGPHHRYSEGSLFDNVSGGELAVQNRMTSGTGHGWAGAQTAFWNCNGSKIIVDAPKGAMNFAIGCIGTKGQGSWAPGEPFGFWESEGQPVTPRSLYYAQLHDRLGESAVRLSTSSGQRAGKIDSVLGAWAGDSAPPDLPAFGPLGVDAGPAVETSESAVDLIATLRYPIAGPVGPLSGLWRLVSGPSNVTIDTPTALQTQVHFTAPGFYEFEFSASQEDLSDPLNPQLYSASDTVVVRVGTTPLASVSPTWYDSIVGRAMASGMSPGYYPSADIDIVGATGSFADETRVDHNLVIAYRLPTLDSGEVIDSADLHFEISAARNHTGQQPALIVYLLDDVDPVGTGTAFFSHGDPDPNPEVARVGRVYVPVAQGNEVSFAPGEHAQTLTLSGDSLALLQSFYGGDPIPDRDYVIFRFSLSRLISGGGSSGLEGSVLDRYRITLGAAENRLELFGNSLELSFEEWIAQDFYAVPPAERLRLADPDNDGLSNAIEAWIGSHPMVANPSWYRELMSTGGSISFSHSINPVVVENLQGSYEWSDNLTDWYDADGVDGPSPGQTVSAVPQATGSETEVTATPSNPVDRVFLRLQVD